MDRPNHNTESSEERKQISKVFEYFCAWFNEQTILGNQKLRNVKLKKLNILTSKGITMQFQFRTGIIDDILDIVENVNDESDPVFSSYYY